MTGAIQSGQLSHGENERSQLGKVGKCRMKATKSANGLYYSAIDAKPREMDWSEGYGERWEYFSAVKCEECGRAIIDGDDHPEECECHGQDSRDLGEEGPMMNYFYPLPDYRGNVASDAKKIAGVPLCMVRLEDTDEYGLALTGGGMDLSWEICEAYMLLGFYPPVHFSDLPEMCGRGNSDSGGKLGKVSARDRWIINGCRKSAQAMIARGRRTLHKLNALKSQKGAK
jgi:hypothetical protein